MYAARWSPRLRQGDVFGEVHFPLPKAGYGLVAPEASPAVAAQSTGPHRLIVPGSPRYAVVLSHDCEFNDRKRAHFLAARIQEPPGRVTPDLIDELRRGNEHRARVAEGRPIQLDMFLLEPLEGVFDSPRVVNFCSITPFPMQLREDMLRLKRAELEHRHRHLLREKLAAFVGRRTDDVDEDFKEEIPTDPSELRWKELPVPDDPQPEGSTGTPGSGGEPVA